MAIARFPRFFPSRSHTRPEVTGIPVCDASLSSDPSCAGCPISLSQLLSACPPPLPLLLQLTPCHPGAAPPLPLPVSCLPSKPNRKNTDIHSQLVHSEALSQLVGLRATGSMAKLRLTSSCRTSVPRRRCSRRCICPVPALALLRPARARAGDTHRKDPLRQLRTHHRVRRWRGFCLDVRGQVGAPFLPGQRATRSQNGRQT